MTRLCVGPRSFHVHIVQCNTWSVEWNGGSGNFTIRKAVLALTPRTASPTVCSPYAPCRTCTGRYTCRVRRTYTSTCTAVQVGLLTLMLIEIHIDTCTVYQQLASMGPQCNTTYTIATSRFIVEFHRGTGTFTLSGHPHHPHHHYVLHYGYYKTCTILSSRRSTCT